MTRFIVKFLLTALLLGAAVWFGLPRLHTMLQPAESARVIVIDGQSAATQKQKAPEAEVENGTPTLPAEPQAKAPKESALIKPLPPAESIVEEDNAQRKDPDYPAVARKGDPPMWGITAAVTEAANLNGEALIPVPGGIPVKVFTEKTIGNQRHMICQFTAPPPGAPTGKILLPRTAIAVYTGDHTRLTSHEFESLTQFFALTAQINKRAADLQQALENQNPHAAAYTRLYEEYQKNIADQKRLSDASKKANGTMMIKISDKLRELNTRGRVLSGELKALELKYLAWAKANPQTNRATSWASDPQIASLITQWRQKNLGIERLTAVNAAILHLERRLPAVQQAIGN